MRGFSLKPHVTVLFFLCISVLLGGVTARAGAKMPHFNLADAATNKMVDSTTYAGKAKLVVFFATWCMPCMQEVPALISLQKEYGNDAFTVVAISVDDRQDNVESFIKKSEVNYPVLMFNRQLITDFGGIPGLPTTFMVDKNDNVLKKYPGLVPHALLEREVKRMLELDEK
jgi:thiol-disulfide isomerase/thioredoxin